MSEETKAKISATIMSRVNIKVLSDDDVNRIIKDPRMNTVIAKEYGVDESHISRIKRFQKRVTRR